MTTTSLAITSGGSATSSVSAGTVVTLTATVRAGARPVSVGQVDFCDATAKSCTDIHLIGVAQLGSAGTATLKFRPGPGNHSYIAVFAATTADAGSVSAAAGLVVTSTPGVTASATTLAETGSWGNYAVTATVTEAGRTIAPTGSVSFADASNTNSLLATGTLGPAVAGIAWPNPPSISLAGTRFELIADLNGDGLPDLIVNANPVLVYLANSDGTYTQAPSLPVSGPETGPMVIADFNGDGIPDLGVALYASAAYSMVILLGQGDGTFAAPIGVASPIVGADVSQLLTEDFNGDGIADLAIIDNYESAINIALGNGDGTFGPAAALPISVSLICVAAGDFNGDSKPDLAITDAYSDSITILSGNGDGTFTTTSTVSSGTRASQIAAADFNQDGKLDLAVASGGTGGSAESVTVLTGNGDGSFHPPSSSQNVATTSVTYIQVADFNQDGTPDIVLADSSGDATVFLNSGGTFSTIGYPVVSGLSVPYSLAVGVGDLNGDGYPDIVAGGYYNSSVLLNLTEPTETATASASITLPAGLHQVDATYAGDSAFATSTSGTLAMWGVPPATATGLTVTVAGAAVSSVTPGTVVTLTATVAAGVHPVTTGQVAFCEASATPCTDIHLLGTVAISSSGSAVYRFVPGPGTHTYNAVYLESGFGQRSASEAVTLTVGPAPAPAYTDTTSIISAGLPGNYSLTATVVGDGGSAAPTGSISFIDTSFGNNVLGSASLGSSITGVGWLLSTLSAVGDGPIAAVTADFNQDGIPDIAVLSAANYYQEGPYSLTVFTGAGDGTFKTGTAVPVGTEDSSQPVMITGDFNGDGKQDLAIFTTNSDYTSGYVTTLLSAGDGTFGPPVQSLAYTLPIQGGDVVAGSMVAADFNGDGKLDLALAGDDVSPGGMTVVFGNGDGTFQTGTPFATDAGYSQVGTGDFNADGIPDLVASSYFTPAGATVYLGKGDGTFTPVPTPLPLDSFPTSILAADFNRDGKADLAIGSTDGIQVFLGQGDGTFQSGTGSSVQGGALSLRAGDFNHDGILDLAGVDTYGDQIDLYLGAGDGTFREVATNPQVGQTGEGPVAITSADFNKDGRPDLVVMDRSLNTPTILLNEPTQTATASVSGIAPIGAAIHNVQANYGGDTHYPAGNSSTLALFAGLKPLVITPDGGNFTNAQTVTLTEPIPGATITYSINGPQATSAPQTYTQPITLDLVGTDTISAYASEAGYEWSGQKSATFVLTKAVGTPPAATPVFSPIAGTYTTAQSITISDATTGATIYYTTDDSTPTTSSAVYSKPIPVATSETIQAIATVTGFAPSAVAKAVYTINPLNPTPVLGSLSPAFVTAGDAGFKLTINGSGFLAGSTSYWGTAALATTFVNANLLIAQVTPAQIASSGATAVTVQNQMPGGGTSNVLQFEVASAASTSPSFTTVTATVAPGSTATYPVTLSSSATGITVSCLNLPSGATCTYAAASSTLTIGTSSKTPAGTYQITVVFSEILPGASLAWLLAPVLLMPIAVFRKRWSPQEWSMTILAFVLLTAVVSGCGGGNSTTPTSPTHQATSAGIVRLTVQ